MRTDQVDTLIDQLEEYVKAVIRDMAPGNDVADVLVLNNMRTSLKEYICSLLNIKELKDYKCPDCGSNMLERKNRNNGNIFYGCTKYPVCKGTRNSDGLSRDEVRAQKEVTQQDGFSFKRQAWKESSPGE